MDNLRETVQTARAKAKAGSSRERGVETGRFDESTTMLPAILRLTAHELATPLTPIRVQLELLKRDDQRTLTDQQRRALATLDRNVDRLSRLIHDVLQGTRSRRDLFRVDKRPMRLGPVFDEAITSFQETAHAAGVDLVLLESAPVWIAADPDRILQVLFNLLTNAIRFTPAGGRITVSSMVESASVVVRVTDTGVGLTPAELDRLFRPFTQVHADRIRGGTGLGLYICKGIVEDHGGAVWAESDGPGTGSTFAFRLPRL